MRGIFFSLKYFLIFKFNLLLSDDGVKFVYYFLGTSVFADNEVLRMLGEVSPYCALHDIDVEVVRGGLRFSWKDLGVS